MKVNNITIVVCVYNVEKFIVETLDSLEQQTLKDFDLLIINDYSPDSSVHKVEVFFQTSFFQSTEIIHFGENRGTAYARNFALHYVKTPFMLFFDADDMARPDLLEKLYKKINENAETIAVSCYSKYIDSHSEEIAGGQYIGPKNEEDFFQRAKDGKLTFMLPPTLFIREFAVQAGGYRLNGFPAGRPRYQDLSEDLDLWSRMSDFYVEGKVMLTLPEVLFYYRKSTSSLSASKESLIAMQNKIRYIKSNLKRRRAGQEDLFFTDYMDAIPKLAKVKNYFKDLSAFYYRNAGFSYVKKSYITFVYFMTLSAFLNPSYIVDKVRSNLVRKA